MTLFGFNPHQKHRDRISAYIDGELSSSEIAALERHLAGCAGCRNKLAELRAVTRAVRALPQIRAPRSFTLTPQMAGRPARSPVFATPAAAAGMRLAGAALAVALAVVIVVDAGNLGSEQSSEKLTSERDAASGAQNAPFSDSADLEAAATSAAQDQFPIYNGSPADGDAGGESRSGNAPYCEGDRVEGEPGSDAIGLPFGTGTPAATTAPGPTPEPAPDPSVPAPAGLLDDADCIGGAPSATLDDGANTDEVDAKSATETGTDVNAQNLESAQSPDDGPSALRFVELALAAALVLVITTSLALMRAARRGSAD